MTHELKKIFQAFTSSSAASDTFVLATVVALEGSSYRRPGVRMLISKNGRTVGAVSGGCVEKEIIRQSVSVFEDGIPKMMTYDGRYRLGCEGILYILIEPFAPDEDTVKFFHQLINKRAPFKLKVAYQKEESANEHFGTYLVDENQIMAFRPTFSLEAHVNAFEQKMLPCFKLIIIGAEHDAVQLCSFASLAGWEVTVIAPATEEKNEKDFPGVQNFIATDSEMWETESIDAQTAIILMTHSFVKDLKYLLALKNTKPIYIGLLGPSDRRERLLNNFMNYHPEVNDDFFDVVYGPSGLNIGAESPQEIAISIISEILSVVRNKKPMMLKDKIGKIHS